MRTEATQYIRSLNLRSESGSCSGHSDTTPPTNLRSEHGSLRTQILNRDLNYRFEIEPATRTYTAFRVNEHGNPGWSKSQRAKPTKPSGKTVHNYIDTIDTGERRELCGYAARRVLQNRRSIRGSETLSEAECDGWYIDPPAAWGKLHPPLKPGSFCYITTNATARDDYKFIEVGERETGFALLETRTFFFRDETENRRIQNVFREEVTEISEAPLESNLFVPPADFERVPDLSDEVDYPLAYRARLRWEMWKDAVSLPNRIRKFIA